MKSDLKTLQNTIGYQFKNIDLLNQALTHRSAQNCNNERFEFLGDAVLNFIVAEQLFMKFQTAQEGQLTRLRADLVKESSLLELAKKFELSEHIILGQGEQKSGGFARDSILADAVEAILGAIYLDSDFKTCVSVLQNWLADKIQNADLNIKKDPKTLLQEWLQAKKQSLPDYAVIRTEGKPHEQIFTVKCTVEAHSEGFEASGQSRRIAEQKSAKLMLMWLKDGK